MVTQRLLLLKSKQRIISILIGFGCIAVGGQFMNCQNLNSVPNKILDQSKLKAFADDKINVTKNIEICYENGRKHCGRRRKCWLPSFSPFPTMFSKGFLVPGLLKVGIVW